MAIKVLAQRLAQRARRNPATDELDPRIEWIGPDDRGIELEIILVMPTALRRN